MTMHLKVTRIVIQACGLVAMCELGRVDSGVWKAFVIVNLPNGDVSEGALTTLVWECVPEFNIVRTRTTVSCIFSRALSHQRQ